MRSPSKRRTSLVVVPLALMAALSLSGCDTKVGTAAVVNGHKISESTLNSYLTDSTQLIGDPASGTPPRNFVLNLLVFNELAPEILSHTPGGPVKDKELQEATLPALQGGTEDDLRQLIQQVGLKQSFEPVYLNYLRYRTVLRTRISTAAELDDAIKASHIAVSVNPRYGTWDTENRAVRQLASSQLPSNVKLGITLPGDPQPGNTATPSGP